MESKSGSIPQSRANAPDALFTKRVSHKKHKRHKKHKTENVFPFVPLVPFVANSFVALLGFEVGVEMRTVQRSHSCLVALARRFRCLPVLDKLPCRSIVTQARPSGCCKFNVGSETGVRTRYFGDRESLYVRHRFLLNAICEDVELQRHCRPTLY